MMNIQRKSIEHIFKTLQSYETYEVYSALVNAMIKHGIDNVTRDKITEIFQNSMREQSKKVDEAKSWADSLLKDLE